ncbi:MAG: tetraacyldisaccharide 4'-kinase [Candidatus Omnitrophica bacterium]|nr:tetraacyldisaccharide 4'-kinase [Candidatus Omnitrophota bacterium]MDD5487621.1 tetraacyldisaccharide 4'-kinase [Candidatus Omnitrophota bacterium]
MGDLRLWITGVMKDEGARPALLPLKWVLWALSLLYGAGIWFVDLAYRRGFRKTTKVDVPVISVGNITAGGTGKTPFSLYIVRELAGRGCRPAILTRGYGRDEDKMLAGELPEVPVVVGRDRVKSAAYAVSKGCDVLVMDDGFQHRALERDLDIVLVDADSMAGNTGLLPRGPFRERISALSRADIVVVTGTSEMGEAQRNTVLSRLGNVISGKLVAESIRRPVSLSDVSGKNTSLGNAKNKKVLLVSGIASPGSFELIAGRCGMELTGHMVYDDHHAYTASDVEEIGGRFAASGADNIVVTKKDMVKLAELELGVLRDKILALNVDMDIVRGKESVLAGLDSVLHSQGS